MDSDRTRAVFIDDGSQTVGDVADRVFPFRGLEAVLGPTLRST
jgi:hypothetical protein